MNKKSIRTLVVEDELPARNRLVKMISENSKLEFIDAAVNGKDGIKKINLYQPELVLLDIELKDYTAFEMLEKVAFKEFDVIFVTAHDEYAIKAFEINAIDYLLKPFSIERFDSSIERIARHGNKFDLKSIESFLANSPKSFERKLMIPEGNKQHFIEGDEVEYIYSQGYYVNLVMNNKKKVIRISLKAMEDILPPNFLRINKSTIVNADKINEIIRNKTSLRIITKDRNEFFVTDKYRDGIEQMLLWE